MKKLLEALEDRNGYLSFKRLTALISFFIAIIIAFMSGDIELVKEFLFYSVTCGALTVPDNLRKPEV